MTDLDSTQDRPATDETRRLAVLDGLDILDTPPEAEFETIVDCAQRLLGTKIALMSLVGDRRQWFKAKRGLDIDETPRTQSFCAHAIRGDDLFVVPNATLDPRFADNPLVLGAPNIRFYAGMPIRAADHNAVDATYAMGTVCIIDDQPRVLSEDEATLLRKLGKLAESLLSARALASRANVLAEERGLALQHLDITHRQFRQAERMANIGSWRIRLHDNQTEWSDQVYAIYGFESGEVLGLDDALTFFPPKARAEIAGALARTIETGMPFTVEADFVTAQGDERRVRAMGELELRNGKPVAVIGVLQDITARHRMEQTLRHRARRDDLTGLANRAYFNEVLDEAMAAARRHDTPLALALIDLDHFKAVNDSHGHLAGDDVLRRMPALLGAEYLAGAFAARLGGDEFVVLLTREAALHDLPGILGRLSNGLREVAAFDDGRITVSATIGAVQQIAAVADVGLEPRRADLALYAAKRKRRGSVQIYRRHRAAEAKVTGSAG
jgi:diguanylate cyclase (GGDEF)-like protein/PAS domain S-box-containing protein